MIIKLKKQHVEYLKGNLKEAEQELYNRLIRSELYEYMFDFNENLISTLRDWASDRLQRVGFDENYNVNHEGALLEELIDILYL